MILSKNKTHGFTLLEILLVVGIIAILTGIVIVAINPSKQLGTARNTERKLAIGEINKAVQQYVIKTGHYPSSITTDLTEICKTDNLSGPQSDIDCTGLIDLSVLVPDYLPAIPTDPKISNTPNGTAYQIQKSDTNQIVIKAAQAELSQTVSLGNPSGGYGGVYFSGTSYVEANWQLDMTSSNTHTFTGWFKVNSNDADMEIFSTALVSENWPSGVTGIHIRMHQSDFFAYLNKYFQATTWLGNTPAITPDIWHFMAVTVTNNNAISAYYDGENLGEAGLGTTGGNRSTPVVLGTSAGVNYLQGREDQVSVFSPALTLGQIQSIYNNGDGLPYSSWSSDVKTKAMSVWEMDDTSGTTLTDSTGNGRTATLHGGATWGTGKIGH